MDVQVVGCEHAAAAYVCTYVCKNEPESLKAALSQTVKNLSQNSSIRKRLSKIGNILLTHRLISSQEAAFRLLNLKLVMSSRETIYISSAPESKRYKILKPKRALQGLPSDSTDIFACSIHDTYSRRPQDPLFDSMCLVQFATRYTMLKSNEKVVAKSSLKRYRLTGESVAYIRETRKQSCFRTYTPKITTDPEGYFHAILCLFLPWRKSEDILTPYITYQEAYVRKQDMLDKQCLQHFKYAEIIQVSVQQIRTLLEEKLQDIHCAITPAFMSIQADGEYGPEPIDSLFTFADNAKQEEIQECSTYTSSDFKTLAQLQMTDQEYMENISNCTQGQKNILSPINNYILKPNKSSTESLHLFITGGAGFGKSYLLKTIKRTPASPQYKFLSQCVSWCTYWRSCIQCKRLDSPYITAIKYPAQKTSCLHSSFS